VVWPGDTTTKPKGWVFPNNGQPLRVGVPNKPSFKELVSGGTGHDNVSGYNIDIFNAAIKLLPYPVSCEFISIGDGISNPNYDNIISRVSTNVCPHSFLCLFVHFAFNYLNLSFSLAP
jgi:ionotropic glutamate receptor